MQNLKLEQATRKLGRIKHMTIYTYFMHEEQQDLLRASKLRIMNKWPLETYI
jgi:hypothetical protein